MPTYAYTAVNTEGKYVKGQIEALDYAKAVEKVKEKGLFTTNLKEADAKSVKILDSVKRAKDGGGISLFKRRGIKRKQLISFMQQLSTLINSGLPIVRSLDILAAQSHDRLLKKVINDMIETISAGGSFSDAMQKFQGVFPKLSVDLIKAGEASGAFDVVLARLSNFMEKSHRMKQKITNALIYPTVVITISMLVVLFLVLFAVPKFIVLFSDLNIELPTVTKVLLITSIFLKSYWYVGLFGIIAFIIFYRRISRQEKIRYFIDKVKLRLPVFGGLTQKIAISRFSRTLNTLISSGVPILSALATAKEVCGNKVLSNVVEKAHDNIREGDLIAQSLGRGNVFPPLVVNMIAVGEESGNLDKSLAKIADIYEDDVDNQISSLTALLEPFLIITLALVVGFIVISMFLPLIKLLNTLSA